MQGKYRDITGQIFGRLTAIKELTRGKTPLWLFSCSCGNEHIASKYNVAREGADATKSCGCLCRERTIQTHTRWAGNVAKNQLISWYIWGAKRRNLKFDLSREDCERLFQSPCYYCGVPPGAVRHTRKHHYNYNGIDRVDNSRGYTWDNCVACCRQCNQAKSNFSVDCFLSWANRLVLHQAIHHDQNTSW